jgi:hypothetical protein
MEALQVAAVRFGMEHFGKAQLGDRRRTRRLVQTADRMMTRPGGTLPDKLQDPAELKGLYRLVDAEAVTHAAVLEPHRQLTSKRMRACEGDVLIVHDTTELDYTTRESLKGLGQIGNGSRRGYLCHNSLAVVAASREVLGLANQILHCRAIVPEGETRAERREREDRESRLWKRGSEAIGPAPAGRRWIDVCDRGGDLFEYLDFKHASGGFYVVRSKHDRRVEVDEETAQRREQLHAYARNLPSLGEKTVEVPARDGRAGRTARVRIAAGRVTVPPPKNPRGEHGTAPLTLWVVYAGEIGPPAGVEPVEWILLTDVPTEGLAQTQERITWYSCRWIVEEYHKGQKTGCGIELPQFTTKERLEPVIVLLSVVAVYLLQLRSSSRRADAPTRRADEIMPKQHVAVLSAWRFGEIRSDLSVYDFYYALARLGGHQNRKHDHPPGWIVLWRGWMKLQDMVAGVAAMEKVRCG